MTKFPAALVFVGLSLRAALCLAQSAPSGDDRVEQARTHFQRGVELYKDRDLDAALVEFNRAYALAENYRVHYNIGQVQLERHDYVAALASFRQYLKGGGDQIATDRRAEVDKEIATLEGRVAKLRIACNVAGAEILIDGVSAGRTPLADWVLVNPGARNISARKAGYRGEPRGVTLAGAESQDVVLTLSPSDEAATPTTTPAKAPPASSRTAPRPQPRSSSRAPLWVGIVATGVLAGGAATFGVLTSKSNRRLDDDLDTFPADRSRVDGARRELKRNALLTDVLAGTALAAGGVTLVIALTSSGSSETGRALAVRVRPHEPGLDLAVRF